MEVVTTSSAAYNLLTLVVRGVIYSLKFIDYFVSDIGNTYVKFHPDYTVIFWDI